MKPVVTYTSTILPPKVGAIAVISGIEGHPNQARIARYSDDADDVVARTSRVVRVAVMQGTCGDKIVGFETENTIYKLKETA